MILLLERMTQRVIVNVAATLKDLVLISDKGWATMWKLGAGHGGGTYPTYLPRYLMEVDSARPDPPRHLGTSTYRSFYRGYSRDTR